MRFFRRLLKDRRGVAFIEFALVAPLMFLAMFGIIETGRVMWTKQTLDEVAYATARCSAVSAECDSLTKQQTYATGRSSGYGVAITTGNIAVVEDTTCNGLPNSKQVTITHGFTSVLDGFVPTFPRTLQSKACFPVLS